MRELGSMARFPTRWDWERATGRYPDLVAFPLKIDWEMTQARTLAEYPAPAYTSRDSQAVELPSAVVKLAQMAREASWEVIPQSSMGSPPQARTGRPTAQRRLIALRFGGHPMTDRQAYAIYESPESRSAWKPRSMMIWGPDLPAYAHCSVLNLQLYLIEKALLPDYAVRTWVRTLETRRRAAEAFQKRRQTVRAQIRKVADEGRLAAGRAETRQEYAEIDAAWREKVADLQDGVFTSDEVAEMIDPNRRRGRFREGLS